MTQEPSAEDNRKKLNAAEAVLAHMKDLQRLIDARGPHIHEQMKPFHDRLEANHFTQEYDDLFKGNR